MVWALKMSEQIQKLINSNDFLAILFNNMSAAVFIVNRNIEVQNVNRGFTQLFKKSENEVYNELCGNAIGCIFPVRAQTQCGQTVNCKECTLRKNLIRCFTEKGEAHSTLIEREFFIANEVVLKYFYATTKYFEYNGLELVLVMIYDVTELEMNKRRLEELNAVKNEFLGIAAHDLRNPISEIMMASSILQKYAKNLQPTEKEELLKMINRSSTFMSKLVNDLLDVAKIESGRLELEKTVTNYNEFIEECLKLNRLFAKEKKITIDFIPEPKITNIQFDRNQLKQVMNNLISNALKFSPQGRHITVKVEKEGNTIVTKVIDEGPGIPAEEIPTLFKPFQRTSVPIPKGERSTGLGLAIAKKIVERHEGQIGVTSQVGKGSIFYFTLPL